MRGVVFIVVAALLSSVPARAQHEFPPSSHTGSATEGFACFENLGTTPVYPKNALQAHVDGSVWTWTQVSPQVAG